MIYLRTEDREVFGSLENGERRDTERERRRARGAAEGGREEEEKKNYV